MHLDTKTRKKTVCGQIDTVRLDSLTTAQAERFCADIRFLKLGKIAQEEPCPT
ncbi:hypothetical protein PSCFBP3800_04763 [Pseudomonas syringae group genomosp. 3]|nr:hypothetical protein PSYMP_27233 [Pseudomonas amygdali pv. morsprunorum str. M302280]SPF20216.1 hypothetical protein PSCFBP3800_04763 [Pseudomonas syringae group genomosp. 3]